MMKRLSLTVFLALCALCVAQAVYYYPRLPETVASHFGLNGQPDAWSSKTFFVAFYLVMTGICVGLFVGVTLAMPKIPVWAINLPNKDYWLSEDRKQSTFDFLFHYFLWFASATLVFLLHTFHQAFQVHLGKADGLTHPLLSVGIFIGFSVVWSLGLLVKFGRKGQPRSPCVVGGISRGK